jgi:mannose-1-phosphate guanylyltransferase
LPSSSLRGGSWVIVLAGGVADSSKSRNDYINGPGRNRFGAPPERPALLKMTLVRARAIAPPERICVLVDRPRKGIWSGSVEGLVCGNVIRQPRNRGSAVAILLAVLTILERDPWARIVALPSRCYVRDEPAFANILCDVATPTAQTRNKVTDFTYIVPGRWFEDGTRSVHSVASSSEKASAREMVARGGADGFFITQE